MVQGSARADRIVRLRGPQWIEAHAGNDTVRTGGAADYVEGDEGDDTIRTGAGADTLDGGPGADNLDGGPGSDSLDGGPGPDHIVGGGGNDFIQANDGATDRVSCGPGRDQVVADLRDHVASDCEDVTIDRGSSGAAP